MRTVKEIIKDSPKIRNLILEIQNLEKQNKIMIDFITNFDWEIRGSHALTATCARITIDQKEFIRNIWINENEKHQTNS